MEETKEFARLIIDIVHEAERLPSLKKSKGTRNRTKEHQVDPLHYSPVQNYLSCLSKDFLALERVDSLFRIPFTALFMQMPLRGKLTSSTI